MTGQTGYRTIKQVEGLGSQDRYYTRDYREVRYKKYGEFGVFLMGIKICPSRIKKRIDSRFEMWEIEFFEDRFIKLGGSKREINSYYRKFKIRRRV